MPSALHRAGTLVLACAILAALFAASRGNAGPPREQDGQFQSKAIGDDLHYAVYLPDGYDDTTARYPVIYVLHGLPATDTGYRGMSFVQPALDRTGIPAIVVAPQASRASETDPEYLDHGAGDLWDTALTQELVGAVDANFRTIRARGGRAIIGISAGGYGAMHLALGHLREFSVVESWSGYFHPTDPTGTKGLDLGSAPANAQADVHRQLQASVGRLKTLPTFIAFYVGRGDTRFVAENQQLNLELARARVPHVFRLYDGGHDQSLWQRYATAWLSLALAHLASPQG